MFTADVTVYFPMTWSLNQCQRWTTERFPLSPFNFSYSVQGPRFVLWFTWSRPWLF